MVSIGALGAGRCRSSPTDILVSLFCVFVLLGGLKLQERVWVWLCNFVGEAWIPHDFPFSVVPLSLCQEYLLRVSHKSIFLDHKSVSQGCVTRQSFRNVLHERATGVFSNRIFKGVSQEFGKNLLAKRCLQCLRRKELL